MKFVISPSETGTEKEEISKELFDVLIIGGGPAGYSSAIYSARYMLKTILITKEHGGAIVDAHQVENYPGFKNITGIELMNKFKEHVLYYNVPILNDEVIEINKKEKIFEVKTKTNEIYRSKTLILALGTMRRKLNLPNEDKFIGKGLSYCAICDGYLFKNKVVCVIGGSDAAASSAILLSRYASKVYIIYRRDKLRAEPYWIDKINKTSNIEIIYNANVVEILGNEKVEGVKLDNGNSLKLDGIFVEIGSIPSTTLLKNINIELDEQGYIVVDHLMRTNIEGVFAAGDVTNLYKHFRQVVVAAAQGAIAAYSAYSFLRKVKK